MKVSCPNCKQVLKVPDDWAGRTARCPHCKGPFSVPAGDPGVADSGDAGSATKGATKPPRTEVDGINLSDLSDLVQEERVAPPADIDAPPPKRRGWFGSKPAKDDSAKKRPTTIKGADGKMYRVCMACGHQVRTDDLYMDLFCSNCGKTIPATTKIDQINLPKGQALLGGRGVDVDRTVSFYDGLVLAFGYPMGAVESILMGTLMATSVIVIPTAVIMGLVAVMKMEPVDGDKFTVGNWPGMLMGGMLLVQLIYCACVGFYALIDSIRSTGTGAERPPGLVFNPVTVTGGLMSYIGFIVFFGLLALLGVKLTGNWPQKAPTTIDGLKPILTTGMYIWLAILTFFMPISIIGLATGKGLQGLNFFRMFRSIGGTFANYIFLYCIVLVYAGLMGLAVVVMLDYTGTSIVSVYKQGIEQSAGKMALGVVFWGLLLAGGFYGQYVLGRILGLFARDFKYKMAYTS